MKLSIFAKKRSTKEGKIFYTYLTSLKKKDGTADTVSVRFRDDCGSPKPENCPINIIVDKTNANLSRSEFIREDTGEAGISLTLWVSKWTLDSEKYTDHSLDEYE